MPQAISCVPFPLSLFLSLLTFLKMLQNAHKKAQCVVCKRFSQQDQKNTMICKKLRQHKKHSEMPNV